MVMMGGAQDPETWMDRRQERRGEGEAQMAPAFAIYTARRTASLVTWSGIRGR